MEVVLTIGFAGVEAWYNAQDPTVVDPLIKLAE
jgi:hypothetical protein